MATTNGKRVLLVSEAGELGCTERSHSPFPGSDSWCAGRWHPMTLRERVDFEAEIGRAPECESCAAIKRQGLAS